MTRQVGGLSWFPKNVDNVPHQPHVGYLSPIVPLTKTPIFIDAVSGDSIHLVQLNPFTFLGIATDDRVWVSLNRNSFDPKNAIPILPGDVIGLAEYKGFWVCIGAFPVFGDPVNNISTNALFEFTKNIAIVRGGLSSPSWTSGGTITTANLKTSTPFDVETLTNSAKDLSAVACALNDLFVDNLAAGATTGFLQLFNSLAAGVTPGVTPPTLVIPIPAGTAFDHSFGEGGMTFSNALSACYCSTRTGGGAAGAALGGVSGAKT